MRDLIFGLARPMLRMLGIGERGALGVLVAVLMGGGVLLGMGALAVDVGRLYQNRAELQNGADAAAFAVARTCIQDAATCDPVDTQSVAGGFATANASQLTGKTDGADTPCGNGGTGATLTACAPTGGMTQCPPNPSDSSVNYVDVNTYTQFPGGSTLLPPIFAETLAGGYRGSTVRACAQVEWGSSGQSNSLALTLSLCAWEEVTGDTDVASDPNDLVGATTPDTDSDDDTSGYNVPVPVYIKGKDKSCAGPGGSNLAGGFDWLNTDTDNDGENNSDTDNDGDASGGCSAYINLVTSTTYNNTGNNISSACQTALQNDVASFMATPSNPVTVFLPVFDNTSGTGNNATYTIAGLAGFVITGYLNMPGMQDAGVNNLCGTGSSTSGNNAPCIQGYFLPGLNPVGSIDNNFNDFGAIHLQLTG